MISIVYSPKRRWNSKPPEIAEGGNYLSLTGNNWDDYSYKTTLNASLFIDGERSLDFELKMLIQDVTYTAEYLNKLCSEGWDGVFPVPDSEYVSVVSNIDFYKIINSALGHDETRDSLIALRDASYLVNVLGDQAAINLADHEGFKNSLLRESGANKAYLDGWRVLEDDVQKIYDFELNLLTKEGTVRSVPFHFQSKLLPYDINVLIGPNGIGKSFCLKSLVEYWLQIGSGDIKTLQKNNHVPFNTRPNIRRLILVSYSPFEEFIIALTDKDKLKDKDAYKYFGFRQVKGNNRIGISRDLPKLNAAHSIIDAIFEDKSFSKHSWWVNKLKAVEQALKNAFQFDFMAMKLSESGSAALFHEDIQVIESESYLRLNSHAANYENIDYVKNSCLMNEGVFFVKDNEILDLSSGQKLFTFIVINVVGAIRENSLVVIDEPELFLHPNLEIEFISLLKDILEPFRSKAILATHSLAIVREVPSNCVHIFRDEGYGLDIVKPPFETFGGDMQRISSYVFGDKSVSKPFDVWLKKMSKKHSSKELIALLKDEINEEMTMKIMRMGRRNGH